MSVVTKFKAWVRYTPSGVIIPGSVILRKKAPLMGIWREIVQNVCCDSKLITATPGGFGNTTTVVVSCERGNSMTLVLTTTGVLTLAELVVSLNSVASYLGDWSINSNGTAIDLKLKDTIADAFCSVGVLGLTVTGA